MCPGTVWDKRACEKGVGSAGLGGEPPAGDCAQETTAGDSPAPAGASILSVGEALAKMQGMVDCVMEQVDRKMQAYVYAWKMEANVIRAQLVDLWGRSPSRCP